MFYLIRLLLLRLHLTALPDGFGRALMYLYLSGIMIWHANYAKCQQIFRPKLCLDEHEARILYSVEQV